MAYTDTFRYGVGMTFAHQHHEWVTRYIHDVTEFTPDEKTIWEAASKDIHDVDCFTIRTLNICKIYHMPIVGSLCRQSKRDLLLCDRCGSVTVTNIQEGLKSCGLTIGMSLSEHIRVAISYAEYNAMYINKATKELENEIDP
jgi:DNA-directed RNA polymerase alpha subunit